MQGAPRSARRALAPIRQVQVEESQGGKKELVVELTKLVARGVVGGVSVGERFCMAKSKFS